MAQDKKWAHLATGTLVVSSTGYIIITVHTIETRCLWSGSHNAHLGHIIFYRVWMELGSGNIQVKGRGDQMCFFF